MYDNHRSCDFLCYSENFFHRSLVWEIYFLKMVARVERTKQVHTKSKNASIWKSFVHGPIKNESNHDDLK